MADQYGLFWNSVNNDRGYTADSFAEWLNHFFTTGVFSGELQVTAASGMDIKVGSGYANLKGKVRFFDSASTYTLATAGATYPRIDTVVVERNDTDRKISIKVVTGTYNGSSPSPTAPVRSAAIYQIVLAQIYVAAGATKITQENITDTRSNNSVCGIVTGTVKEMDYSQFAAQFNSYYSNFKTSNKADFDAWFNGIKGQLTSDAAGKLQAEINSLSAVATTSANGLMSAEDKTALDGLKNDGPMVLKSLGIVTTANVNYGDSKLRFMIASGETSEGKPDDSGYILNFSWDNDKWESQLFLPSTSNANSPMQYRFMMNGEWKDWISLYSENNPQKSTTKKFTLSANNWKYYGDHYYYDLADPLITANSNQEIIPAQTITLEQLKALQKANLNCDMQMEGHATLRVYGTVPTIDIPIAVIFRGTI